MGALFQSEFYIHENQNYKITKIQGRLIYFISYNQNQHRQTDLLVSPLYQQGDYLQATLFPEGMASGYFGFVEGGEWNGGISLLTSYEHKA